MGDEDEDDVGCQVIVSTVYDDKINLDIGKPYLYVCACICCVLSKMHNFNVVILFFFSTDYQDVGCYSSGVCALLAPAYYLAHLRRVCPPERRYGK